MGFVVIGLVREMWLMLEIRLFLGRKLMGNVRCCCFKVKLSIRSNFRNIMVVTGCLIRLIVIRNLPASMFNLMISSL